MYFFYLFFCINHSLTWFIIFMQNVSVQCVTAFEKKSNFKCWLIIFLCKEKLKMNGKAHNFMLISKCTSYILHDLYYDGYILLFWYFFFVTNRVPTCNINLIHQAFLLGPCGWRLDLCSVYYSQHPVEYLKLLWERFPKRGPTPRALNNLLPLVPRIMCTVSFLPNRTTRG